SRKHGGLASAGADARGCVDRARGGVGRRVGRLEGEVDRNAGGKRDGTPGGGLSAGIEDGREGGGRGADLPGAARGQAGGRQRLGVGDTGERREYRGDERRHEQGLAHRGWLWTRQW